MVFYGIVREAMFLNSTEFTFSIASFQREKRLYPKGGIFSNVRGVI